MLVALNIMLVASIASGFYHRWLYPRRVIVYLALVYLVAGASNLCAALAWLQPWSWRLPSIGWGWALAILILVMIGIGVAQGEGLRKQLVLAYELRRA